MSASDEFEEATDRIVEAIGLGEDEVAAFAQAAASIGRSDHEAIAHALAVLTPHPVEEWRPTAWRLWAYGYTVKEAVWLGRQVQHPDIADAWLNVSPNFAVPSGDELEAIAAAGRRGSRAGRRLRRWLRRKATL